MRVAGQFCVIAIWMVGASAMVRSAWYFLVCIHERQDGLPVFRGANLFDILCCPQMYTERGHAARRKMIWSFLLFIASMAAFACLGEAIGFVQSG